MLQREILDFLMRDSKKGDNNPPTSTPFTKLSRKKFKLASGFKISLCLFGGK